MPSDPEFAVVSVFTEGICYGIYLASLGPCLRFMLWKPADGGLKPWSQVNRLMLTLCVLLYLVATINLCLNAARAFQSVGPAHTSEQFTDIGSTTEVIKVFCVDFQTILGDFILLYRYWMTYEKSCRQTILPAILWIGVVTTTILNVVVMRQIHDTKFTAPSAMRPVIIAFWCISIALNIFTTGRIAWRLYTVDRAVREAQLTRLGSGTGPRGKKYSVLRSAMRIIVQSGMIYTACAFITWVVYIVGSDSVFVVANVTTQVVGIAFNLIIIRVAVEDHNRNYPATLKNTEIRSLSFAARRPINTLEFTTTQELHSDMSNHQQTETKSQP